MEVQKRPTEGALDVAASKLSIISCFSGENRGTGTAC